MVSRSPLSGGMCFSVPATVRGNPPCSALRSRTRMSITRRSWPALSGRPSLHASSGTLPEKNTRYGHIPSARPTASVRFTVSSSRSSAASANCITTARGCKEGCRAPSHAPDQTSYQGLLRAPPDRGLFRRRDSEQDKVHRKAGAEDTRQSGCRLPVLSRHIKQLFRHGYSPFRGIR